MSYSSSNMLPKIYTCSETVQNVNFVDINFTTLGLISNPNISANCISDKYGVNDTGDINVFISNITNKTARINFSTNFVGTVHYTVVGFI